MDGARHLHFLGRWVEMTKRASAKPELAGVALVTWDRLLPCGGATGLIPGSHRWNMRTVLAATESGGISNLRILLAQSFSGRCAVDPVAEVDGEKVLHAGDAILMHPYLTHSSAWNYQHTCRIASHMQFRYKNVMDVPAIQEMRRRQFQRHQDQQQTQGSE